MRRCIKQSVNNLLLFKEGCFFFEMSEMSPSFTDIQVVVLCKLEE